MRLLLSFVVALWLAPLGGSAGAQEPPTAVAASLPVPWRVPERELVVLLHGMGRTSYSMALLKEALVQAGFDVLNIGYSSYCCSIAELGESVGRQLEAERGSHTRVHFVGHSLGGIIARWLIVQPVPPLGVGRLVMLAPPNQGSRSADFFAPVAGWLMEPLSELRTDSTSTVRRLPAPRGVEIGIIAARDDGKVDLEHTHLVGETAHVVVDGTHTFIMRRADVHALTIHFLREGRFVTPFPMGDGR